MPNGFALSPATAQRVMRVTETVERQQKNLPHEPPRARVASAGFYAKITGSDGNGRYDWEAVHFDFYGDMVGNGYTGQYADGTGFAVEVNKALDVLTDDVVELRGARTYNVFQFAYTPGVQPASTTTAISKRSGNTPGDGTVQVERYDSTTGDLVGGQTIKAYNSFDSTIDSGVDVHVTFGDGGLWWITAEACGTDGT